MSLQIHPDFWSILKCFKLEENDVLQPMSSLHLHQISLSHCRKWRSLPVALDMENHLIWEDIEREAMKEEERKIKFFSQWQSEKGADANYKRLVNALLMINCKQDAEQVCRLIKNTTCSRVQEGANSFSSALARENLEKIKGHFASVVNRICVKLNELNTDMKRFRPFIANLFPPGNFLHKVDTVTEVFNALTHNRLWDHLYYCSTFEAIYREFGKGDHEMREWIDSYKAELAGFKATTKIIDYIEICNEYDDIADSEESISQYKARYDRQYFRKLTIKLEVPVTEKSLVYIDEFWRSVSGLYLLPSLPVLLERICLGSTEIALFVSLPAACQIESLILNENSIALMKQFNVLQVTLNDKVLFDMDKKWLEAKIETKVEVEGLVNKLKEKEETIMELQNQVQWQALTIKAKNNEITKLQDELEEARKKINDPDIYLALQTQEAELRKELQRKEVEVCKLQEELEKFQSSLTPQESLFDLKFTWQHSAEMPFGMSSHIHSVRLQDKIYVGGGKTGWENDNDCIVMEYDIFTEEWATLPPYYRATDFAMTVVNKQLLLVGGYDEEQDLDLNILGVWIATDKKWAHPYPEMITPRYGCSAITYNNWVIVAGGGTGGDILSSIEILNTDDKQWYTGPPTPGPWIDMKTALVGDLCYFIGDHINGWGTDKMYSISVQTLLLHLDFDVMKDASMQIWYEIASPPNVSSSLLSFGEFLLVVGGWKNNQPVSAIHLYQPETEEWSKIGDLPTPRYNCTCLALSNRELFIAGGSDSSDTWQNKTDIATIT